MGGTKKNEIGMKIQAHLITKKTQWKKKLGDLKFFSKTFFKESIY